MKKNKHKRMMRAQAKHKAPSAAKQAQTAIANLQNLLWLAAHMNGGALKIPHSAVKNLDLTACRLDIMTAPDGEEPGYIVKAEFNLAKQ